MTCISLALAYASVGKVKDIYRQVIYLKHKDHKTLVHIKDQLEKYIEINSGFGKYTYNLISVNYGRFFQNSHY